MIKNRFAFRALTALLVLAVLSCGLVACKNKDDADDPSKTVMGYYQNSAPTKVETKTVQTTGDITLNGNYILTTGLIGDKNVAVYEEKYQQMRSVESGGESTTIYGHIEDVHNLYHYVEGTGTRQVHPETHIVIKDWDINGRVFDIEQGSFAMNLKAQHVTNVAYADGIYTATVPAANTATVLGQQLGADVKVTVRDNGAQIVSVTLEYTLPANGNVQETAVVINITYTYDNERINID